MYGKEHLEWCEKQAVAAKIDQFLADLPEHERVYALAILRERHTVYKEGSGLSSLLAQNTNANMWHSHQHSSLQAALERERQRQGGSVLSFLGF